MATSTVENYIKQIYLTHQQEEGELLPMGKLASTMGVVPGTATAMVKALADSGLVRYEPRGGICLTRGGEQLALHVLRRHRILELYLVRMLGLDWSEVHEEAETLEHALSDKVLNKMDEVLGHPEFDPHGDPIPNAKGHLSAQSLISIASAPEGVRASIARISDQDAAFLQFAERHGLTPGVEITLKKIDSLADSVTVKLPNGKTVTLGTNAASKIFLAT